MVLEDQATLHTILAVSLRALQRTCNAAHMQCTTPELPATNHNWISPDKD